MILRTSYIPVILSALSVFMFSLWADKVQAQADTSSFAYQKPLFDFDYQNPVFKLSEGQKSNKNMFLRYSGFTGYREGVMPIKRQYGFNMGTFYDEETGMVRQSIYNASIIEMLTFGFAVNGLPDPLPSSIIIEAKDPSVYMYRPVYGDKDQWMRKNGWCYELMMPMSAFRSAGGGEYVKQEIMRHFSLRWGEEKRKVKALLLVRTNNEEKFKTRGQGPVMSGEDGRFNNAGLEFLGIQIEKAGGMPPFVDETGYSGTVDMELGAISYNDLPALRKSLNYYGLDLKEEVRELKMYILKEIR
ncbi:hypothetical protein [Pararcticibacter amylolyticus]|nr:hypothetical protein [Pararcticibacter amylolyticus]